MRVLTATFVVLCVAVAVVEPYAQPPTPPSRPSPLTFTTDPQNATCAGQDDTCEDWLKFRRAVDGPYQTFAIAVHPGHATVILAEPFGPRPELLDLVDTVFGARLIKRSYKRWMTGLDGWLEDIVLDVSIPDGRMTSVISGHDLARWRAPAGIVDRLLFLYEGLYGTTDGFFVDNVNAFSGSTEARAITEMKIGAADVLDWLLAPSRTWYDTSAAAATSKTVQQFRPLSVYVSGDHSLVTLALPAQVVIGQLAGPFRRFAVASDFLLGAYRLPAGVTVLVGRARQLPFTTLPALRFETLASFIQFKSTELAQSYERKRVFAGKIENGPFSGWDWAPILLSSQLDDSEFGTLLNEADQILKSWSEAGEIDYFAFAHAKPNMFPFGAMAASEYFTEELGTTSLVFNWNTTGFTTIHQIERGELLTPDRYGALPILYLPTGSVADLLRGEDDALATLIAKYLGSKGQDSRAVAKAAAQRARNYFAERGDPILIRVAQNVLLFQAVDAFLSAPASSPPPVARWMQVSQILRDQASQRLTTFAGTAAAATSPSDAAMSRAIRQSGLTITQLAELIATPQATTTRLTQASARYEHGLEAATALEGLVKAADQKYRKAFDDFCASVSGTKQKTTRVDPKTGKAGQYTECKYTKSKYSFTSFPELQVDIAEQEATSLERQFNDAFQELEKAEADLKSLSMAYDKAEAVAKQLAKNPLFSEGLDAVLEQVRARTNRSPATGSIRTPAVVLSRNTKDESSVGGHNIAFEPTRIDVPPVFKATGTAKVERTASIPRPNGGVTPEVVRALNTTRSGSLLEELRTSGVAQPIEASVLSDLRVRANGCNCDALVVQSMDGDIYFVRNQPPPLSQRLEGTPSIVDALAGPPKPGVVRFDGFADSPDVVEDIARSAQLAGVGPVERGSAFRQLKSAARSLFGSTQSAEQGTWFSFAQRDGSRESVRLLGDTSAASVLTSPTKWRTAQVISGTPTVPPAIENATSVTVRFPVANGPVTIESVDVIVGMGSDRAPATAQKLVSVVQATLPQTPAQSKLIDGVLALRKSINEQMKPAEIGFFFRHNAKTIRVSELQLDRGNPSGD